MFLALLHELSLSCQEGNQVWIGTCSQGLSRVEKPAHPAYSSCPMAHGIGGQRGVLPSIDQKVIFGTSLVAQWLESACQCRGHSLIPGLE